MGVERISVMFYDDPALVRDMVAFWTDYIARLMERALSFCVPDEVHFSEDMAYKGFAMISPAMTREHLLPAYQRWGEIIRAAGVPVYGMDSDGFIGELIPIWMEAGINLCDPIEVAAGNDINAFRAQFGKRMAYRGGVDKRAMAKGGKTIEAEIDRLRPVMKSGGYIPSCDHGVPPDVAWPDYLYYVKLLAGATGWLP
jgi:uroporphyrinogen decarboxylase